MLCLGRKIDEVIKIGKDIYIKVLRFDENRDSVILGVEAPKNIKIIRKELEKTDK